MISKCIVVVVISFIVSSVLSLSHGNGFDNVPERNGDSRREPQRHQTPYHHSRSDEIDQEQGTSHFYEVRKHPNQQEHKFEYHIGHKRPDKHRYVEPQSSYKPKKVPHQHNQFEYSTTQAPQRQEDTYSQFHEYQRINEELYKFKQQKVLGDGKPKNNNFRFNSGRGNSQREQPKKKFHYERENEQYKFRPENPSPFKLPKQYEHEEAPEPSNTHEVRQNSKPQYVEHSEKPKYKTENDFNQRYKNHNYDKGGHEIGQEEGKRYEKYIQQETPHDEQKELTTQEEPVRNQYVYRGEEDGRKTENTFRPSQEDPQPEEEENVPYVRPYPAYVPEPSPTYEKQQSSAQESRFQRPSNDEFFENESFRSGFNPEVHKSQTVPERRLPFILAKPTLHKNIKDIRPLTAVNYPTRQEKLVPLKTIRNLPYEPRSEVKHTPYKFEKPVLQRFLPENAIRPKTPFKNELKLPYKISLPKQGGRPQSSDDLKFPKAFTDTYGSPLATLPSGRNRAYLDSNSDPKVRNREVTVPRFQRYASRRHILNDYTFDVTKDIDLRDFFRTLYNH